MSEAMKKVSIIPQDDAPIMMPIPQTTSSNQLLAVLSRMMSDPSVDIERIERGAALYERALARDAETAFNVAMVRAQEAMRPIQADANNPQTKSKYATYAALDAKVRPIYTSNGFSLSFDTAEGAAEGSIRVVCLVAVGGYSRTYHLDMPADGKGAKGGDVMTKTHATGAAMTYGRRYLLCMIFNLVIGEDNDGNAPAEKDTSPPKPGSITQDQADQIRELLESREVSRIAFLQWAKVARIEDIPAEIYDSCIEAIRKFKPKAK
jgi:hypothetical protein